MLQYAPKDASDAARYFADGPTVYNREVHEFLSFAYDIARRDEKGVYGFIYWRVMKALKENDGDFFRGIADRLDFMNVKTKDSHPKDWYLAHFHEAMCKVYSWLFFDTEGHKEWSKRAIEQGQIKVGMIAETPTAPPENLRVSYADFFKCLKDGQCPILSNEAREACAWFFRPRRSGDEIDREEYASRAIKQMIKAMGWVFDRTPGRKKVKAKTIATPLPRKGLYFRNPKAKRQPDS